MWKRHLVLSLGILSTAAMMRAGGAVEVAEPSGTAQGDAVVLSKGIDGGRSTEIVVAMDEARPGTGLDGRIDRVFRLQGEFELADQVVLRSVDADVSWTSGVVTVSVDGRPILTLARESVKDETRPERTFSGFGLSHSTGWTLRLPEAHEVSGARFNEFVTKLFSPLCTTAPGCSGGGKGAISCKLSGCPGAPSGCETTCGDGSYACCWCSEEPAGACCRCIAVPPPPSS